MNFTVGNVRITVSFLLAVGLCAGTQAFFYTLVSRDTKVVHAEWREV